VSISNPQIFRIATDDDVRDFFTGLYEKSSVIFSEDNDKEFCSLYNILSKTYNIE
jgi:hypothetical protein